MNKPEKCKNCQWYGKPYWSIINPCDSCSRNEETTLVYKINMPMFQDGELERFDDNIHTIADEFTKMHLKEKDMILSQRLVKKLEEENKKLKSKIFWLEQENIDKNEGIEAYLSMLDERDNRINKAIEYIENCNHGTEEYKIYEIATTEVEELLDILEGSEENDK